ncbi:hypothetical protein [Ohtaekwangia sp.]|uniref:hypothetical protein n=1 Tax=Ohtaekwangia sp. TaxID=2066019 RepID=UPI002F92714B
MKKIIGALLAITWATCALGQNKIGNFYVTWGYHRDSYTRSTIHFKDNKTDDYNFTLEKARAKDKPDMHDFFHTAPTVPQYVFNLGYFFANKPQWGIEVSWDHLKYVVTDNQVMHLKGEIRGKYFDQDTLVTPQFVHFEHTNGNNYLMISAVRRFTLEKDNYWANHLSVLVKAGAGGLIPKTDSYIMGKHNDGPFRLSGFVVGTSVSLRYDFLRYLYVEGSVKGAFADYTDAKLYEEGRARHSFFSAQYIYALGINVPLHK